MYFCGIDWAENHLDFFLENCSGDVIERNRIDNSDDGYNSLLSSFVSFNINIEEVLVAIESPHQRIVDFLLSHGVQVYPVNPKAVFDYRKSRFPSGSKSDAADAQLIADYLREHYKHLRAWYLEEPELRQLKLLSDDRDKLVTEKVRLQNQLRSTLIEYYPQAVKAFSDLSTQTALEFLSRFPTFDLSQSKTESEWNQFLDECRCYHPSARQRFIKAMKLPSIEVSSAVVSAKSLFVTTIVRQLKILVESIKEYNNKIVSLLNQFDDGERFRSLPGVDIVLAAKLLSSIGTDRDRFISAEELQSFYGTAPYTKGSGKHRTVHFRIACQKEMRVALEQMARASLRCSVWAKNYYNKKRKEGKSSHHALRCLANLWLKVIYAIWKNRTEYDENIHLASITRHQLSQPTVAVT